MGRRWRFTANRNDHQFMQITNTKLTTTRFNYDTSYMDSYTTD